MLALIEGSDPKLKDEVILVGAHYDHVGYGTRSNSLGPWGYVHNGADDNASGTAGLRQPASTPAQSRQRFGAGNRANLIPVHSCPIHKTA